MLTAEASGVFPIAPTPFCHDERLHELSIDRLAQAYRTTGASGPTVLGTMGEASKLEPGEAAIVARRFIEGMGQLPVIVGVSAAGFAAMRSLSRTVMEEGAAGVMIAPLPALRRQARGVEVDQIQIEWIADGRITRHWRRTDDVHL